jgi:hypothetical protein
VRWIRVEDKLPEKGETVLVWSGDGQGGFDLACIGDGGTWERRDRAVDGSPTHWMFLPGPPGTAYEDDPLHDIAGEITEERLVLNIDERKEAVAALMQHFIDGRAAVINGERYFVLDMRNEMAGEGVASVFYLKKVIE